MAGTVLLRTLPILFSGQNVNKTQTSQEALRSPLTARILTQQLIRKDSEINACLSLIGRAVKRSGLSYDSPLLLFFYSIPDTPTGRVQIFMVA